MLIQSHKLTKNIDYIAEHCRHKKEIDCISTEKALLMLEDIRNNSKMMIQQVRQPGPGSLVDRLICLFSLLPLDEKNRFFVTDAMIGAKLNCTAVYASRLISKLPKKSGYSVTKVYLLGERPHGSIITFKN